MEETALFTAMAILIVLASFSAIILGKLKLPSIIGFLVTGIVVVNYIGTTEEISMVVDIFSDLGLVMLLFIIGLEIEIFFIEGPFHFTSFLVQGGLVALGELGVCFTLGLLLYKALDRPQIRNFLK